MPEEVLTELRPADLLDRYKPEVKPEVKEEVKPEAKPEVKVEPEIVLGKPEVKEEAKVLDINGGEKKEEKPEAEVKESKYSIEQVSEIKKYLFEEDKPKEVKTEEVKAPSEYDQLFENPLVKAAAEYVKNGGNDVEDFVKQLGIQDVKSITPEQFFMEDIINLGVPEERREAVLAQKMDSFNELTEYDQMREMKKFRDRKAEAQTEKLKKFSAVKGEEYTRVQQLKESTLKTLESETVKLKGTRYRGVVPIEESMVEQILKDAAFYSTEKYDGSGKLVGYDTEKGLRIAQFLNLGKKAFEETFEAGVAEGQTKTLNERNRPADDSSPVQGTVQKPNIGEDLIQKLRERNGTA